MRRRDRFDRRKTDGKWWKRILLLIMIWLIAGAVTHYRVRQALLQQPPDTETLASRIQTARWTFFFPLSSRLNEIDNLNRILNGDTPATREPGSLFHSEYATLLDGLLKRQELDQFRAMMDYLAVRDVTPSRYVALYRFDKGLLNEIPDSLLGDPFFDRASSDGTVPIIDSVVNEELADHTLHALLPGTQFLIDHIPADRHHLKIFHTDLNPAIQRILYRSMEQWDGSFLLARSGRLMGMVGKGMDPIQDRFEAGSVIKVVTMAAALDGGDLGLMPYTCDGPIRVSDRIFYDWTAHGKLADYPHSLACSCNLVFAETGLRLGPEVIRQWMSRFGLQDEAISLSGMTIHPAILGPMEGDWDLARASIGLDAPRITPYWLIMTAATLAGDGTGILPTPFTELEVPGYGLLPVDVSTTDLKLTDRQLDPIRKGMRLAVQWDQGTGRRAEMEGIDLYLKTGTSGPAPYDAIMLGFFDLDGNRYAFGLYLRKGGKAEYNAARVLRNALGELRIILQHP